MKFQQDEVNTTQQSNICLAETRRQRRATSEYFFEISTQIGQCNASGVDVDRNAAAGFLERAT